MCRDEPQDILLALSASYFNFWMNIVPHSHPFLVSQKPNAPLLFSILDFIYDDKASDKNFHTLDRELKNRDSDNHKVFQNHQRRTSHWDGCLMNYIFDSINVKPLVILCWYSFIMIFCVLVIVQTSLARFQSEFWSDLQLEDRRVARER